MLKVGDKAPKFSLYASDKSKVSLDDYKKQNVVLIFFPHAFTRVCTAELCSMRDSIGLYRDDLDAQILAISVDSLFTLAKFKEENGYNFPLLSDFNKKVCKKYGAYYDTFVFDMKGVARRAVFVIDKKGIVRYVEVLEAAGNLPDFDAVKTVLEGLKN